ncbi:hypothetical protein DS909_01380 [Phaeobacter gallaeciensis]|uniref:Uncharacterized protein n=2 Tax=Roseobacteraceae TaxID=2854170 RepID=A0A366XCG9_9RHOB|nr:hypothetical protein DS909_01380 [Phaeobacter gallaeciensis]
MAGLIASTPEFDSATSGAGGDRAEAETMTNGTYVVTWSQTFSQPVPFATDTPFSEIAARLLNADGTFSGGSFQVNTAKPFLQSDAEVTALSGGGFVIAWTDQTFGTDQTSASKSLLRHPLCRSRGYLILLHWWMVVFWPSSKTVGPLGRLTMTCMGKIFMPMAPVSDRNMLHGTVGRMSLALSS